jgi:hypothetical protein
MLPPVSRRKEEEKEEILTKDEKLKRDTNVSAWTLYLSLCKGKAFHE